MFLIFLIKHMCLLAFYFAYANLTLIDPSNKLMILVYFIIIACHALSYTLRFSKKYAKLKYIPLLGIIISMLFVSNIRGAIGVVIPYAFMLYFIRNDEYDVSYYSFKDLFIYLFYGILFLLFLVFITGSVEFFNKVSLPYAIIFIISGLYLMRTARHSEEIINNKKFMVMNALMILLTSIISIVLSTESILYIVIASIKLVYSNVIAPIISGIIYVLFLPMAYFLNKAEKYEEAPPNPFEIQEFVEEDAGYKLQEPNVTVVSIISYVILILLLALAIYFVIKIILSRKRRRVFDHIDGVEEYRSFLDDEEEKRKSGKEIFSKGTNQIRHWYKKFLVLCSKRRISIHENDSSNTVYNKSSFVFTNHREGLKNMKEIYRKARYSEETIENEDIKTIKKIYKSLEKEKFDK